MLRRIITFFIVTMLCATSVHGLEINYNFNHRTCFPQQWYRFPVSAETSEVRTRDIPKISGAIKKFLSKYPVRVVDENLHGIYIFGELRFFKKDFGGTFGPGKIYLRFNPARFGDWPSLSVRQLHHEFSSVLMKNHRFPKSKWISSNKGNYVSRDKGRDMLESLGRDEHNYLFKQGFLTSYGSADFENDINIYAEYVFVFPGKLKRIGKRHPAVAKKSKIIKDFYCRIDRSFFFCQK